jgi:hypothetical protein
MLKPQMLKTLQNWEVTRPEPANLPLVRVIPKYIVAVCSMPRR